MAEERDAGFIVIAIVLSALIGALLAGALSFTLVSLGTAVPNAPIDKPLITYDGS
jgi:hypothetical protein